MLPRCARAIETGYSIFYLDLIFGHHLGHRRVSQESRLFEYGDRGFGMRILPSYFEALEAASSVNEEHEADQERIPVVKRKYESLEAFRKPKGAESGLKTVKRIAQMGMNSSTDYVKAMQGMHRLASERMYLSGQALSDPVMTRTDAMDYGRHAMNKPDARQGLGSFEYLMQHSHIWHLEALGEVRYVSCQSSCF